MKLKQAPSLEIPIRENKLKFIPWVGINLDDKDLHPIYISVPKPPPDESIDGYGLPPEEQYFRRKEWPVKLVNLYKNVTDELKRESDNSVNRRMTDWKIYLRFWEYLERDRDTYEEEIKFIKHMWYWRTYGYWFWNDGEITFLPPDYFDFLNCYIMGDGDAAINDAYPEYRDKDRRKYTFKWYLENTDETFAEYDEENIPVKRHGEYEMDNLGNKIFFGMAEPKTRRSGATHQAIHKGEKTAMTGSHKFCTIVSLDGDNAETHYKKKARPAWWTYPFFLKPISPSPRNAMSISFGLPEGVYGVEALESLFTFTKSAGEKKNDGDKINGLVSDEEGKCFAPGTLIKMHDGSVKAVENIVVGDVVMGADSTPRLVLETHSGMSSMYKIIPNKGQEIVVNDRHIIQGYISDHRWGDVGDVMQFTAPEFLSFAKSYQKGLVLKRVGVEYPESCHEIPPYLLGLWLGDGTQDLANITNIDPEVIAYIREYCAQNELQCECRDGKTYCIHPIHSFNRVRHYVDNKLMATYETIQDAARAVGKSSQYISWNTKPQSNPGFEIIRPVDSLLDKLRRENLLSNKHIPSSFLRDSRKNRLQLLAGIIDTDGNACKEPKRVYEIIQKRRELSFQIVELARSLGFYCSIMDKLATMRRKDGSIYTCPVYRIRIYGKNLDEIPCLIKRKRYNQSYRSTNKDPMKTGFKIEAIGKGSYYGFTISGDGLFLLSDYTIVHNSDLIDIHERWSVNRLAMATGGGTKIWGWSDHPSTIEDMTKGGAVYQALCTQSEFYNRDPSKGQTISGLALCFFPNYDGLEGFIDIFGMSVIDSPTERQIRLRPDAMFAKLRKGAKQVLQDELDNLLRIGTPEAMKSYRSLRRKQPMCYADCWRGDGADSGFNMEKIELALAEHRRLVSVRQEPIIHGYFRRNEMGRVEWITDPSGRFEMAKKIPKELIGLKKQVPIYDPVHGGTIMHYAPMNGGKFIACGDTYAFDPQNVAKARKNKSNQSDGGFAIFWDRDSAVDQGDDISTWESYRFVLSYRARPKSLQDYQEDCLLACEYFGAYMYPETNRENLVEYFYRKGYAGYLLWDIDSVTGKRKAKPGFFSLEASKNDIFSATKDYIEYRAHKEYFASYLTECRDIGSVENMRHFDRFAAHGGCLIGLRALRLMAPAEGGTGVNLGELSLFKKRQY